MPSASPRASIYLWFWAFFIFPPMVSNILLIHNLNHLHLLNHSIAIVDAQQFFFLHYFLPSRNQYREILNIWFNQQYTFWLIKTSIAKYRFDAIVSTCNRIKNLIQINPSKNMLQYMRHCYNRFIFRQVKSATVARSMLGTCGAAYILSRVYDVILQVGLYKGYLRARWDIAPEIYKIIKKFGVCGSYYYYKESTV